VRGKLADFGIASLIGTVEIGHTTTGTAAYLSPEQVEGRPATAASDVYSLGLVLLEAISGATAFPGSVFDSALARLDRDPLIPQSVPAGIAAILHAMTARRPEDRAPLEEVAAAFQAVLVDILVAQRSLPPRIPVHAESEGLAALQQYNVLHAPSDDAFDRVTRLASRFLRVPIALVAIVDADHVWFKSGVGWDERDAGPSTTSCSAGAPGAGPWSVPDALLDPRTRNNPLVIEGLRVRSYAAAPLVSGEGRQLGALCVFDREPREFAKEELDVLTDLGSLVVRELELRLASRQAASTGEGRHRQIQTPDGATRAPTADPCDHSRT
jgi:GAF domain-containing protein